MSDLTGAQQPPPYLARIITRHGEVVESSLPSMEAARTVVQVCMMTQPGEMISWEIRERGKIVAQQMAPSHVES